MALTIKDAENLVNSGNADAYIGRFVGSVQQAMVAAAPFAINLDDALVASMALTMLAETKDGRQLLKKPKRKNTQYKTGQFGRQSPQRMVARAFVDRELNYPDALNQLEAAFDGGPIPDKERTLKRLLDDLIRLEEIERESIAHFLGLAGWDGDDMTREDAANRVITAIFGHVPGVAK